MDAVREAKLSEQRMVSAGLRQWSAATEGPDADFTAAVVELMITAHDGSLVDPGWPWVCETDELGVFWLDPEPMRLFDGVGGELCLLPVVEALLGGRRVADLVQFLDQLDRRTRDLVLAAFTRASVRERDLALYAFGGDPSDVKVRPRPAVPTVAMATAARQDVVIPARVGCRSSAQAIRHADSFVEKHHAHAAPAVPVAHTACGGAGVACVMPDGSGVTS